jgi:hypothetical protein
MNEEPQRVDHVEKLWTNSAFPVDELMSEFFSLVATPVRER